MIGNEAIMPITILRKVSSIFVIYDKYANQHSILHKVSGIFVIYDNYPNQHNISPGSQCQNNHTERWNRH